MLGLAAAHAHRRPGGHLAGPAAGLALGVLGASSSWPRSPSPPCSPSSRRRRAGREATVRGELGALRRPQVLLTLLVGIVGFGGMFALYSYIAPLVTDVAGLSRGTVPLVLLVYGAGGVVGTALGGRLADLRAVPLARRRAGRPRRAARPSSPLAAPWAPALFVGVFLVVGRPPRRWPSCLQMRLMETAGDAQMLGAALNHSALNLANALGAWLGGLVIAAGLGYRAPSVVGAGWPSPGWSRWRLRRAPPPRPRRRPRPSAPPLPREQVPVG